MGTGSSGIQQVLARMQTELTLLETARDPGRFFLGTYSLPQALLAVISDVDFTRPAVMERRRRDHERIDTVLAARVLAAGAGTWWTGPCNR